MKSQFKNIISMITVFFLFLVLFSNGYFQKEFFIDKWGLPDYMANILLIVENGSKVLLELAVSVLLINGISRKKYLATIPFILLVIFLVSFGIFQSFATRTYYSQKEVNGTRLAVLKNKAQKLQDYKTRLENKLADISNQKKQDKLLEQSIKKQTLQFITKLDGESDKWLINKQLDKLTQNLKPTKITDQTKDLLIQIAELDSQLIPLTQIKFTYTEAMDNVFLAKVSSWDIASDIAPALTMEALIVLLTAFLGFFWKPEISNLLVIDKNEQQHNNQVNQELIKQLKIEPEKNNDYNGIKEYVQNDSSIDYDKVKSITPAIRKQIKLQDEMLEKLKEKIEESQLSQEEFANNKLGISKVGLWKILNGNIKTIKPEIFARIKKTVA